MERRREREDFFLRKYGEKPETVLDQRIVTSYLLLDDILYYTDSTAGIHLLIKRMGTAASGEQKPALRHYCPGTENIFMQIILTQSGPEQVRNTAGKRIILWDGLLMCLKKTARRRTGSI